MRRRRSIRTWAPFLLLTIPAMAADSGGGNGVATPSVSPSFDRTAIHLAAATLRPLPETSLLFAERTAVAAGEYILQLDGPMTPERRSSLEAAGVIPGDYLPFHTYVIHIDRNFDASRLKLLSFVRWVGAFEPAWKRHPDIGRRARDGGGESNLTVTLFTGADPIAARRAIERVNGAVVHHAADVGGHVTFRITIPNAAIDQLVAIDAVRFI
ncbi:MAG: hypothetical protein KDA33_09435, partial [Phycisphaerales bacterium]|nr:hypothetical protein [Phycisphaerales bacterium]